MPSLNAHSIESLVNDVPDKPTLFIVEGRYQNWIKPLMILEALHIPYDIVCLAGLPAMKTEWYRTIHPQRMVPALIDRAEDNENERLHLWDSAAMMTYLTDRYDPKCLWTGRSSRERVEVLNWLTFATASLCPTAKYWVSFDLRQEKVPEAQNKMYDDLKRQYDVMNERLNEPGQNFLALKDRATIADIANLMFAEPVTSGRMGLDLEDWPALSRWSKTMLEFEGVERAMSGKDTYKGVLPQ